MPICGKTQDTQGFCTMTDHPIYATEIADHAARRPPPQESLNALSVFSHWTWDKDIRWGQRIKWKCVLYSWKECFLGIIEMALWLR